MVDVAYNLNLMVTTTTLIITLIFTVLFGQEWRKQNRSKNEQYIPFALMILYLFLFLSSSMMCYSNFFTESIVLLINSKFYFISVINFIVIVMSILIFIAERIIRKKTKHFFLIYFIVLIILLIILKVLDIPIFIGFYFIISIPMWVLISLFIYKLGWRTSGQLRQKMIIALIGYSTFSLAVVYEIWLIFHDEVAILFEIKGIILLAAILMGYGFHTIPSFTEFDWDKKIRHLYILNPNGLCLFQHSFKMQSITDEDLLGGSLIAIQSLMKEMIQSDKFLQVIDHGDAKIIFDRNPYAIGIIIADEDLYVLHFKLKRLLKEFDLLFGPIMTDWAGNLDIFKTFCSSVNKIFEIKP